MRLVAEIDSDHSGVAGVALCQHLPVGDPTRLRILGCVPKPARLCAVAGLRAMVVENHLQAKATCVLDDPVEDLKRVEPAKIAIDSAALVGEADCRGDDGALNHLAGEGNPHGIETVVANRLE